MTVGAAGETGRHRRLLAAWIACGVGAAVALTGLVAVLRAVAGLLTYDPMGAEGGVSVTVDGQQVEEASFGGDTAPLSYSCGPDRLEEYDSTGYRSTFERVH